MFGAPTTLPETGASESRQTAYALVEAEAWPSADGLGAESWLHVGADLAIFVACTAIPVFLASFIRRRDDLPFPRIFWLFSGFIFAVGLVHLVEALNVTSPHGAVSALFKLLTAACSIAAAASLIPILPRALRLPGLQRDNERLRRALEDQTRLAAIVADSRDAIFATHLDGRVSAWNRAAEELFGWRHDEIVGEAVDRLFAEDHGSALERAVALDGDHVDEAVEVPVLLRDRTVVPGSFTVSPIHDPETGVRCGASWILRDIRERLQAQERQERLADHLRATNRRLRQLVLLDPLTGLLNRRGLEAALTRELERADRNGVPQVVMLVDCDDFKAVNDRHGHEAGDVVLRQIAQRLQSATRTSDHIARIGGDEFLLLLPETRFAEGLQLAERVRLAVADLPFAIPGGDIEVTVSIGVESVAGTTARLDELLRRTGAALRRSKVAGKNLVSRHGAVHEGDIESLIGEDLEVRAQPIVRIEDGATTGYEMLIRGPKGPFRNPTDFFRACREQGVLTRVDLACLRACLDAARLLPRCDRIHANLFPSTVEQAPEGAIEEIVANHGFGELTIELNESMLVGDPALLLPRLAQLRAVPGLRIAIDDVGFGRSSLEALVVLEPDLVKIDRRYVDGAGGGGRVLRRHLERMLQVAASLGAEVVAEGVETDADRDALVELGVERAQGFLWERPRAVAEFAEPIPGAPGRPPHTTPAERAPQGAVPSARRAGTPGSPRAT